MECLSPLTVRHQGVAHVVPCGKCIPCGHNRRVDWVFRIRQEVRHQEMPGWFITLTYAEHMLPRTKGCLPTLRFRHVQLMLKRIRKAGFSCKYVCVGEYGPSTGRPHYHMLLWTDCPIYKVEAMWSSKSGKSRGHCHVGTLSIGAAMYTMKYVLKPREKPDDGREFSRAQFSRGLGLGYLTPAVYYYHSPHDDENERPVFRSRIDGKTVVLPRYYRDKIFTKYQRSREAHRVFWERVREHRRLLRECYDRGMSKREAKGYLMRLRVDRALLLDRDRSLTQLL